MPSATLVDLVLSQAELNDLYITTIDPLWRYARHVTWGRAQARSSITNAYIVAARYPEVVLDGPVAPVRAMLLLLHLELTGELNEWCQGSKTTLGEYRTLSPELP